MSLFHTDCLEIENILIDEFDDCSLRLSINVIDHRLCSDVVGQGLALLTKIGYQFLMGIWKNLYLKRIGA